MEKLQALGTEHEIQGLDVQVEMSRPIRFAVKSSLAWDTSDTDIQSWAV
ncbi:MAG: hypothetical protein QUS09_01165 [Methanotrichaceae archaeon]|nr:hypothetical protein [Methanotrichaceae archaeon]